MNWGREWISTPFDSSVNQKNTVYVNKVILKFVEQIFSFEGAQPKKVSKFELFKMLKLKSSFLNIFYKFLQK